MTIPEINAPIWTEIQNAIDAAEAAGLRRVPLPAPEGMRMFFHAGGSGVREDSPTVQGETAHD